MTRPDLNRIQLENNQGYPLDKRDLEEMINYIELLEEVISPCRVAQ